MAISSFLCLWFVLLGCACHSRAPGEPQVDDLVQPQQDQILRSLLAPEDQHVLDELVIFGDSLSDTGRLSRRSLGLYIPEQVYWQGRVSNGPNWADYACGTFACRMYNYAVAGAGTRSKSLIVGWFARPLDAQIAEFQSEQPGWASGSSVAVIWIGANNYLRKLSGNVEQTRADILESATQLLQGPVDRLMIGTMPELAGVLSMPDEVDPSSPENYKRMTAAHNAVIRDLVVELQGKFPQKSIAIYDAYEINEATLKDPAAFGFTSMTSACYQGNYRGHFFAAHSFCPDYFGWKFWDYTHPNSRMHCFYATRFLQSMQEAGWLHRWDRDKAIAACLSLHH